jgi:hypothetical protein
MSARSSSPSPRASTKSVGHAKIAAKASGKVYTREIFKVTKPGAKSSCYYKVGKNKVAVVCKGASRKNSPKVAGKKGRPARSCSPPRSKLVKSKSGKTRCVMNDTEFRAMCISKGKVMNKHTDKNGVVRRTCALRKVAGKKAKSPRAKSPRAKSPMSSRSPYF